MHMEGKDDPGRDNQSMAWHSTNGTENMSQDKI